MIIKEEKSLSEFEFSDGASLLGKMLTDKEKNIIVRESEQNLSLYEITRRTQDEQGIPIIVIIDEEHLFWSKTADQSKKVLERINPKV